MDLWYYHIGKTRGITALDDRDRVFEIRKITLDDWTEQVNDYHGERVLQNEQVVKDAAVISAFDGKRRAEKWKPMIRRCHT